jgi:EpsI family protein
MDDQILAAVGAEDYLWREYGDGASPPVSVYVGYYEQQKEGDQIHSPKHCLPGAGWQPVEIETIQFDTPGFNGGLTRANRYVVEKGGDRQLVLYWYQSRGRDITSEYVAKLWLAVDSIFRKRNDGSLIRLMTPIAPGETSEEAQSRAVAFSREFLPELGRVLPD